MKLLKTVNAVNTVETQDESIEKGILIVDDSKFSRNILKDILKNEGFNIISEAKNGLEAIEMTKQKKPEYIFMDVEMPMLDGLGAIPKILEVDPFVHIIMCTAMGQKNIIVEAARAGAKDYVLKPYKKENIIRVLSVFKEAHQKDGQIIPFKSGKKHQEEELEVVSPDEKFVEGDFDEEELRKQEYIEEYKVEEHKEEEHKEEEHKVEEHKEEEYKEEEYKEEEYKEGHKEEELREIVTIGEEFESEVSLKNEPEIFTGAQLPETLWDEGFAATTEEKSKGIKKEETVDIFEEGFLEPLILEGEMLNDSEGQFLEPLDLEEAAEVNGLESLEFSVLEDELDTNAVKQILEVQVEADTEELIFEIKTEEQINDAQSEADTEELINDIQSEADTEEQLMDDQAEADTEEQIKDAQSEADTEEQLMDDQAEADTEELINDIQSEAGTEEQIIEDLNAEGETEVINVIESLEPVAIEGKLNTDTEEALLEFLKLEGEAEILTREENTQNWVEDGNPGILIEEIPHASGEEGDFGKEAAVLEEDFEAFIVENKPKLIILKENSKAITDNCCFTYLWENRFDLRPEGTLSVDQTHHRLSIYNVIHSANDGYGLLEKNNSDKEIMSGIISSYLRLGNRLQSEEPLGETQRNESSKGVRFFTNKILEEECNDRNEITMADILKSSDKVQKSSKVLIQKTSLSNAIFDLVQGKANRLLG